MSTNWVAIFGKIDVEKDSIKHIPSKKVVGQTETQTAFTLARSDIQFANGTVEFEATIREPDAKCQLGLNQGLPSEIYLGLNVAGSSYGIARFSNGRWDTIVAAGFGDKPPVNQALRLKVRAIGSLIELHVNDVKVCFTTENILKSQIAFLMQSSKEIEVKNLRVRVDKPRVFVVMQYAAEYDALYEEVIKPTCEAFGFDVIRADESYRTGLIIEDITRSIREASLVIADITPNNANVFYELGFAHGIGKPTILMSDRDRETLPFDVSGYRTLFYDNSIGGKTAVEERLRKHLENLMNWPIMP